MACLEDLPGWSNTVIGDLLSELSRLDERIAVYDQHIAQMAKEDNRAKQLMQLRGVGETTATAMLAMIGSGHDFKNGRQFAAWLGLVPSQYSSGGKARLDEGMCHPARFFLAAYRGYDGNGGHARFLGRVWPQSSVAPEASTIGAQRSDSWRMWAAKSAG